jgi:hypothetical protein
LANGFGVHFTVSNIEGLGTVTELAITHPYGS